MSEHLPDLSTTRRTLLRTTAWGVPAVSLAAAVPAFAGSGPVDNTLIVNAYAVWSQGEGDPGLPPDGSVPLPSLMVMFQLRNVGTDVLPLAVTVRPPLWNGDEHELTFLPTNGSEDGWEVDHPVGAAIGDMATGDGEVSLSLTPGLAPGAESVVAVLYDLDGLVPYRQPTTAHGRAGTLAAPGSFFSLTSMTFTEWLAVMYPQPAGRQARRDPVVELFSSIFGHSR